MPWTKRQHVLARRDALVEVAARDTIGALFLHTFARDVGNDEPGTRVQLNMLESHN